MTKQKSPYYVETTKKVSEDLDLPLWEVRLIIRYFFKSMKKALMKRENINIYRLFCIKNYKLGNENK